MCGISARDALRFAHNHGGRCHGDGGQVDTQGLHGGGCGGGEVAAARRSRAALTRRLLHRHRRRGRRLRVLGVSAAPGRLAAQQRAGYYVQEPQPLGGTPTVAFAARGRLAAHGRRGARRDCGVLKLKTVCVSVLKREKRGVSVDA